jgi:hypothetical protein
MPVSYVQSDVETTTILQFDELTGYDDDCRRNAGLIRWVPFMEEMDEGDTNYLDRWWAASTGGVLPPAFIYKTTELFESAKKDLTDWTKDNVQQEYLDAVSAVGSSPATLLRGIYRFLVFARMVAITAEQSVGEGKPPTTRKRSEIGVPKEAAWVGDCTLHGLLIALAKLRPTGAKRGPPVELPSEVRISRSLGSIGRLLFPERGSHLAFTWIYR